MPDWALLVRGGRVVLPGIGIRRADVAIRGGRIAAIGEALEGRAARVVEAAGLHVLPGLVDPHVHFGIQGSWADECRIETRAALVGGVTTVGCYLRELESYLPKLDACREAVAAASAVDLFFHLQLFSEQQLRELPRYAEAGVTSFKVYMAGIPGVVPHRDDGFILDAFAAIARLGPDCVACLHAESAALVERGTRRAAPRPGDGGGTLADWSDARPALAEVLAARTGAFLARRAGVPLYIVHVTSAETVRALRTERQSADWPPIHLEATSAHLGLDWGAPTGLLAKLVPPVRDAQNRAALWQAVAEGAIGTLGTDNTARTRASKRLEAGLLGARPGYHGLGTHLPVLLDEGYHRRGIPLGTLVERGSAAPARVFGLYPRKGAIAVGSDADLVLVDLERERTVDPAGLGSVADFSPFEGRTLRGWPVLTIKGGEVVVEHGRLVGSGPRGRYLARGEAAQQTAPSGG
jgi:dihydropyrimidinase